MCSVNHDLKAIYVRVPKTGGEYIEEILCRFYGFQRYYLSRADHYDFLGEPPRRVRQSFLHIHKKGIYRYYRSATTHLAGLDDQKWEKYTKFTFVRNPYDRFVSGFKYIKSLGTTPRKEIYYDLGEFINKRESLSRYTFFHLFLTQHDQLMDDADVLPFQFIGRFEDLENDLEKILNHLGVKEIRHQEAVKKNIRIHQSLDRRHYSEFFNDKILSFCNQHFRKDFEHFGYPVFSSVLWMRLYHYRYQILLASAIVVTGSWYSYFYLTGGDGLVPCLSLFSRR